MRVEIKTQAGLHGHTRPEVSLQGTRIHAVGHGASSWVLSTGGTWSSRFILYFRWTILEAGWSLGLRTQRQVVVLMQINDDED